MAYILGVDGGNSKTLAIVADRAGRVAGVGRSGCGNHQARGLTPAMDQVRLAIHRALRSGGVATDEVAAGYFCLAGADLPEDFDLLRPALESIGVGRRIDLNNDIMAILRSGSDNPNAVAVGWGAGTNAMGRNAEGDEIRLPGLGWISGDWGGGGELAQEAVRLVARAHDGRGEPTLLTDLVLAALGVSNADEMIRKLYFLEERLPDANNDETSDWLTRHADPLARYLDPFVQEASLDDVDDAEHAVVHLTPLVFQAARAGDTVSSELLQRAGAEVATTATALLRRLGLVDREADVVLGGSVFKGEHSLLLDAARAGLAQATPLARVVVPEVEPVIGAMFCAIDMLDVPVDAAVRERARLSYQSVAGAPDTGVRA